LPAEQVIPAAHTVVQVPQCNASVLVFTQAPLQSTVPGAQMHALDTQTRPAEHTLLHAPQWLLSTVVSAQVPAQFVGNAAGHAQALFTHDVAPVQAMLQPPQLALSVAVFTHDPEHDLVPVGHTTVHAPPAHDWPDGHGVAHPPQCKGSRLVSTHTPLHSL